MTPHVSYHLGQLIRPYRIALAWQIALAVYMQLISWVPLGRWNYQPCCAPGLEQLRRGTLSVGDGFSALIFLLPMAVFWLGARRNLRWAMSLSVLALGVWLTLQIWTWWPPFLFGASEHWSAVYARAFAESTPIFPRWGNHLPPDAAHFVLQVLLAGSVASGTLALRRFGKSTTMVS
jgi:hypothetical protein